MRGFRVLKIGLIGIVAVSVMSAVVMVLWNTLLPGIFAGVRVISFWQALGLLVLCKILFGGFRPSFRGHRRWRERMIERWEKMSPEERDKFRQGMGRGCFMRRDHESGEQKAEARA